ncbi:MAG: hypothetical protein GY803_01585, partial [Chloroflexi bacterium]|nr:hypothetical protein [Chloroflexota bacterium]
AGHVNDSEDDCLCRYRFHRPSLFLSFANNGCRHSCSVSGLGGNGRSPPHTQVNDKRPSLHNKSTSDEGRQSLIPHSSCQQTAVPPHNKSTSEGYGRLPPYIQISDERPSFLDNAILIMILSRHGFR